MQAVLDMPMSADDVEEAFGREWLGEDVVAAGGRRLAVDLARSGDLADRLEVGETVPLREPGDVVDDCGPARLDPAVVAVDRLRHIVGRGLWIVEQQSDVLEKRLLVALHGQHIVAAALQNRFCGRSLAVHRIRGHDAAVQGQERQELGQGADFVRLSIDLALPERQPRVAGEGAIGSRGDQVQRTLATSSIERPPRGLAVDRDHAFYPLGECCHVAREARLEGCRIEQPKHPRDRVVARNTARQPEKPPQQRLLRAAEQRHVDTGLRTADHRQKCYHHDLVELMPLRVASTRIHQVRETSPKPLHAALPKDSDGGSRASFNTKRFNNFLVRFPWREPGPGSTTGAMLDNQPGSSHTNGQPGGGAAHSVVPPRWGIV